MEEVKTEATEQVAEQAPEQTAEETKSWGDFVDAPDGNANTEDSSPEQSEEAPDATGESEAPGEKPEAVSGEPDIKGLDEGQFEELVARLTKDPKSPFNDNPAWKRIITQRDKVTERSQRLFKTLAQTNPQAAKDYLIDAGYETADADRLIADMGVTTQAQPAETEKAAPIDVDMPEFLNTMGKMGVEYDGLTSEQREFWKFQFKFNKAMMAPYGDFMKSQQQEKLTAKEQQVMERHKEAQGELVKHLKDKFNYTLNDVIDGMPINERMMDYFEKHPQFVGDPSELFYVSHRGYIAEMGAREQQKKDATLTKEKKSIKSEQPGSTGGKTVPEGVGKDWTETWKYLDNKYK